MNLFHRWAAQQFARPYGLLGSVLVGPWLDRIGAPLGDLALAMLGPQPGEAVLDLGFGGGRLLRILAGKGTRVTGIDASPAMAKRAAKRFGDRATIHQGDAALLPFEYDAFDGAVSVSVLHFWPELGPPLSEISRVLRPGGRLVLVFEEPGQLRRWPGHRYGFRLWSSAEVIAAASESGLALTARREGQGTKPASFIGLRFDKEG